MVDLSRLGARVQRKQGIAGFVIVLLTVVALVSGCASTGGQPSEREIGHEDDELVTVVIPTRVVNMAHQGIDDLVDDLRTAGEGHYESIDWSGTEGVDHEIAIVMAEGDRAWWTEKSEGYVADVVEQFSEMGDENGQVGYKIVPSGDFTALDFYYNLAVDPQTKILPYFYSCEYFSVMRQLFAGDGDGSWHMMVRICNSDTGNLVKDGYTSDEVMNGGLNYTTEDWERSYGR